MFFEGKMENGKWRNSISKRTLSCLTLSGKRSVGQNSAEKKSWSPKKALVNQFFASHEFFVFKEPTAQVEPALRVIALTNLVPKFALKLTQLNWHSKEYGRIAFT